MNFLKQILIKILAGLAANDALIAESLELALPQEAPFIALADAIYQAEIKNPGALKGQSFPLSIKGVSYTVSVS